MSDVNAPAATEDITYNSNIPYNNEYDYNVATVYSYEWFLGSTKVDKMYVGDKLVTAAYLGTQKVYEG